MSQNIKVLDAFRRFSEAEGWPFLSLPIFRLWCQKNNYVPTTNEEELVLAEQEAGIFREAMLSKSPHLRETILSKMLTKYHGYDEPDKKTKFQPVTINFGTRPDEKGQLSAKEIFEHDMEEVKQEVNRLSKS